MGQHGLTRAGFSLEEERHFQGHRNIDDAGKLLALNLEGMNGLKPGAAITVVGEVREANDAVLVVDATGLAIAD